VAAACDYLLREDMRLLTVTGAPSIGKTLLSLQVAADLLPHFRDGVFFVELAPANDPSQVASAIAAPLGLMASGNQPVQNDLKRFLSSKRCRWCWTTSSRCWTLEAAEAVCGPGSADGT
jgi:predicted ATPase